MERVAASRRTPSWHGARDPAGFGSPAFTSVPAIQSLGRLVTVGLIACLAGTFFLLLPLLLRGPRNVMSDLEQSGLIFAPHTSAGRLPTELGLRFFVDAMLELGDVGREEQERIEAQMRAAASRQTFDSVLAEASSLLSGVSRGAGVVLTTKANVQLKHIEFVRLDPARALVVLVSDDGSVENRLLDLPAGSAGQRLAGSLELPQRPSSRADARRLARGDRGRSSGDEARTRCDHRAVGRCRPRGFGRARARRAS